MDHFYMNPCFGENWFTYQDMYSAMVKRFPSGSHFVEIGAWKGRSAAYMGVEIINSGKNILFDTIDTFQGSIEHQDNDVIVQRKLFDVFSENTKPVAHAIRPVVNDSVTAASTYADASIDFVFIDGDHTYVGVKKDIIAWLPKVKPGGIIAGHDYASWFPDTMRGIEECFPGRNVKSPWIDDQSWLVQL